VLFPVSHFSKGIGRFMFRLVFRFYFWVCFFFRFLVCFKSPFLSFFFVVSFIVGLFWLGRFKYENFPVVILQPSIIHCYCYWFKSREWNRVKMYHIGDSESNKRKEKINKNQKEKKEGGNLPPFFFFFFEEEWKKRIISESRKGKRNMANNKKRCEEKILIPPFISFPPNIYPITTALFFFLFWKTDWYK